MDVFDILLNILFPPKCVHCGVTGALICPACYINLPFLHEQFCPACKSTSVLGFKNHGCQKRSYLDQLYSLLRYQGVARALVNRFKFAPYIRSMETIIAQLIKESLVSNECSWWQNTIIIPVPLHKSHLRQRGYNQSEIIATALAKEFGSTVNEKILLKKRQNKTQSTLPRAKRKKNVTNVYAVHPQFEMTTPQNYLLVDDVYTSGSTLDACAKVLKQELHAEKIYGFTLTRG